MFFCVQVYFQQKGGGMTGDYFIAVTALYSSTKNLVLLSGDVVI